MDKAGDFVKSILAYYKIDIGENYKPFFSAWHSIVGYNDLAKHSQIVDLNKDILVVEADHSGWIQRLKMEEAVILKRISREYPELNIKKMQFKLVPEGKFSSFAPPQKEPVKKESSPVQKTDSAAEEKVVQEEVSLPLLKEGGNESLKDKEFRESLLNLKKSFLRKIKDQNSPN